MRLKKISIKKLVNVHLRTIALLVLVSIANLSMAQTWSLEQCIETAQKNNKQLQISNNNILLAKEKHKEVIANLIPKLELDADYKYFFDLPYQLMPMSLFGGPAGQYKEVQFGVPHNINVGLTASMPLYSPDLYGAIKTTKIAEQVAAIQYEKSEEDLYFEISNLYYNAQILKSQEEFIDKNILNLNKLLANMKLLHEQLLIKGTDVDKVDLQLSQLSTNRLVIANKNEQIIDALKFLVGVSEDEEFEIESNIEYTELADYEVHSSIENRLISTQNLLLKSQLKTINQSRYLPTIALFGSYGYTGFAVSEQPNDFLDFYKRSLVGVKLNYTLFNGTVSIRQAKQKKIEIKNNELQDALINDKIAMEINNAQNQKHISKAVLENQNLNIELAQKLYDQTLFQLKQGTATLTDVLLADNALRESQQAYLAAIIDYLKADLELKKKSGNIKN